MSEPILTDAQVVAGIAMLFLISAVVVVEWFERAIQDHRNEHDGYDEARERATAPSPVDRETTTQSTTSERTERPRSG